MMIFQCKAENIKLILNCKKKTSLFEFKTYNEIIFAYFLLFVHLY